MADVKAIYDHYLTGGVDAKGIIKQVWGKDALANAVKVWLALSQGEIIRRPTDGGVLMKYLSKTMSPTNQINMQNDIIRSLTEDFAPSLTQVQVSVTPEYDQRCWSIYVMAYCSAIKDSLDLQLLVRSLA